MTNANSTARDAARRAEVYAEFIRIPALVAKLGGPERVATATEAEMLAALREWRSGGEPSMVHTVDLGNNESMSRGVFPTADGTFLALSFSQSKTFKTRGGAERWLARRTDGAK